MKAIPLLSLLFILFTSPAQAQQIADQYRDAAEKIIQAAIGDDEAFEYLTEFVDTFGHRFSGSESLERSIDWIIEDLKSEGIKVWTQPVMVPHWVRGEESATMILPREMDLPMLGRGGSVGTPEEGLQAEVIVVNNFEELESRQEEVPGKIVLYNVPFTTYGSTVQYRTNGAVRAAALGAVGSLVRSVGPYSMKTPHTGNSRYQDDVPKIPHAAITTEHASLIQRMTDRGERVVINLKMSAQTLPDAESRNLMAEIEGSEFPDEIIVMGGHIDSWDVGQGAMDDAGGCFAALQALKYIKELGLKPKRTIRVVLWTNEENGLRGGNAYRDYVMENGELDKHVLAMESDSGVFDPIGFGFSGSDEAFEILTEIGSLLSDIESGEMRRGGGGADIGPIMREGVPGMGLNVDGEKYFWYHHTAADTIDKLNKDDYNECVATMAVFAYVVADMDQRLPR
jgi:carboxypeptidase Q